MRLCTFSTLVVVPKMTERTFSPGFRFSRRDAAVLLLAVVAGVALCFVHLCVAVGVAFVVGHFFLFCNVFRLSRPPELIWATAFACLMVAGSCGVISWWLAFLAAASLTPVLVVIETRRPSYHGVWWEQLNPHLPEWWRHRVRLGDQELDSQFGRDSDRR